MQLNNDCQVPKVPFNAVYITNKKYKYILGKDKAHVSSYIVPSVTLSSLGTHGSGSTSTSIVASSVTASVTSASGESLGTSAGSCFDCLALIESGAHCSKLYRPCFIPCFLPDLHRRRSTDKLDLFGFGRWRPAAMRTAMICIQFGNVQLQLLFESLTIHLSCILTLSSTIQTPSVSCTWPRRSFACAPSDRHSSVFAVCTGFRLLDGS